MENLWQPHGKKILRQTTVCGGGGEERTPSSPSEDGADSCRRPGAGLGSRREPVQCFGRGCAQLCPEKCPLGKGCPRGTGLAQEPVSHPAACLGPGLAPTLPSAPVNCSVGFLLPCPRVQCIHCYCCLFPPLKITSSFKHQSQRGNGSLMFIQSPGTQSFNGRRTHRNAACRAGRPRGGTALAGTRPSGTPSPGPVTAAWVLAASEPREQRSGKAQL